MNSYGHLHRKNSQHRQNILLSPKGSYSRTSSQHRIQTLSYSRQLLLNSTSSTQFKCSNSANLRTNKLLNDYCETAGCKSMIPESGTESTEVLHCANKKETDALTHSTYLKQNERLLRQIVEERKKIRGRSSSTESERSQFEQMHTRFGKWSTQTSDDDSEEDQCVLLSRERGRKYFVKPLSRIREYDTSGTEEDEAKTGERDFCFPNVPANLNDPKEFQKLMAYTSTVLGEPCYNLEPTLSISESPTPVVSSPSIHSDLDETQNSNTTPNNNDNFKSFYEQREESQWWYSHNSKSSQHETKVKNPKVSSVSDPTRTFEPFIGASFVHQSRTRMRGMFNILGKINSRGKISEIPSSHLAVPLLGPTPSVTVYVSKALLAGQKKMNENHHGMILEAEEKSSQKQEKYSPKVSSTDATDLQPLHSTQAELQIDNSGNGSDVILDKNGFDNCIGIGSSGSSASEVAGETFMPYDSPEYMTFYTNAKENLEIQLVNSADQDEDAASAEAINENQTQDISYKGHLAPGGLQKAEVNSVDNSQEVEASSSMATAHTQGSAQSTKEVALDEDKRDTEENQAQESNVQSEGTNAGSNVNQENAQQYTSQSQRASTSDAQTNIPQTASLKKRLTKPKKLSKSRKSVSRTSSQSRASSKHTSSDGSDNETTSRRSKSRHKLSSPHVVPRPRKKSHSKLNRRSALEGQKPIASTSAAADPINAGSQPEKPSTPKSGLPVLRPRSTLYHGTKLGQPNANKSTRHVSIKLPTPSESVDSQNRQTSSVPNSHNIEQGPSVQPLDSENLALTHNPRQPGLKSDPTSLIQEKVRHMPGPSKMPLPIPKLPFGGKGKALNKNTATPLRLNQLKGSSNANDLRTKAQTGYFGMLQDRQKREQQKREREHRLIPMNLEFEMPLHGNLRDRVLSPPRNVSGLSAVPSTRINSTGPPARVPVHLIGNHTRKLQTNTKGAKNEGNSTGKGNL